MVLPVPLSYPLAVFFAVLSLVGELFIFVLVVVLLGALSSVLTPSLYALGARFVTCALMRIETRSRTALSCGEFGGAFITCAFHCVRLSPRCGHGLIVALNALFGCSSGTTFFAYRLLLVAVCSGTCHSASSPIGIFFRWFLTFHELRIPPDLLSANPQVSATPIRGATS